MCNEKIQPTSADKILYQQFLDCRLQEQREMVRQGNKEMPLTLMDKAHKDNINVQLSIEEKVKQMVQQAEAAKAKIFKVSGRELNKASNSKSKIDNPL